MLLKATLKGVAFCFAERWLMIGLLPVFNLSFYQVEIAGSRIHAIPT